MTSKHTQEPVKGPCAPDSNFDKGRMSIKTMDGEKIALLLGRNAEANGKLIVEAFNVAHETGMSPRQLAERVKELERGTLELTQEYMARSNKAAEQRAELLAALKDARSNLLKLYVEDDVVIKPITEAIAKVEGRP